MNKKNNLKSDKISVIIPTKDRRKSLLNTIKSYRHPLVAEVIIVEDGNSVISKDDIKSIENYLKCKVIHYSNSISRGVPFVRNIGISLASSEYILMGEDDVSPSEKFIDTLYRYASSGNNICTGPCIRLSSNKTPDKVPELNRIENIPKFDKKLLLFDYKSEIAPVKPISVSGSNAICLARREIFKNTPYDEKFGNGKSWREETDFYLSNREKGVSIFYIPQAISFHLKGTFAIEGGCRTPSRLKREFELFRNNFMLFKKHKEFLYKSGFYRYSWFLKSTDIYLHNLSRTLKIYIHKRIKLIKNICSTLK